MTKEDRIELLKLAREAKKAKSEQRKAMLPPVVKGRPRKIKEQEPEQLEQDVEKLKIPDDDVDELLKEPVKVKKEPKKSLVLDIPEPEVVYEEVIKKKPKKKIVRKIIYEDDSEDEVEEEVIDKRTKNKQTIEPKKVIKPQSPSPPPEPKQTEMPKSYLGFFNY